MDFDDFMVREVTKTTLKTMKIIQKTNPEKAVEKSLKNHQQINQK